MASCGSSSPSGTAISGVCAVIVAVALVAIGLPARRAIGVDPMAVLRDE